MNICGRFTRVSASTWHDGIVLVGFCGNVYPHDLSAENIVYIKNFYMMPNCKHEFFTTWPENISASCSAAKTNFKNGFMLLSR